MSNDPKLVAYEESLRLGAVHYLKKPIINEEELRIGLLMARKEAERIKQKQSEALRDIPDASLAECQDGLVLSKMTRSLVHVLAKSATIPCIIHGETGTGKEMVARLIHKERMEVEGNIPFIAVNCANIDSNLAASLLFGHKRGAFTGANCTTNGFVGDADNGILFLDEIHSLSIECQRRLLRVLNDGKFQRVGDTKEHTATFQVIAASTRNIKDMVTSGEFLQDLRSRLGRLTIELKPLRERAEDLDLLVPLYFSQKKIAIARAEVEAIVKEFKRYYWSGNIRDVIQALDALSTLCELNGIPVAAKELLLFPGMLDPSELLDPNDDEIRAKDKKQGDAIEEAFRSIKEAAAKNDLDVKKAGELLEKNLMIEAMCRSETFTEAFQMLGMSRTNFDLKRKKYALQVTHENNVGKHQNDPEQDQ